MRHGCSAVVHRRHIRVPNHGCQSTQHDTRVQRLGTCGAGEVAGGRVDRPEAGRAEGGAWPPPPPALAPLAIVLKDVCTSRSRRQAAAVPAHCP